MALALKQCDKLSAFVEASLSISHGIKSKELISGKKEILKGLKEINGVDFKAIRSYILNLHIHIEWIIK
jgi:putative hydrolase of HD superfamily